MRNVISWGQYYWPFFMILVVVLFGIPEIIALFSNPANTLSEYSWTQLDVHRLQHVHTVAWWISIVTWGIFVVVITWHIWGKGI